MAENVLFMPEEVRGEWPDSETQINTTKVCRRPSSMWNLEADGLQWQDTTPRATEQETKATVHTGSPKLNNTK